MDIGDNVAIQHQHQSQQHRQLLHQQQQQQQRLLRSSPSHQAQGEEPAVNTSPSATVTTIEPATIATTTLSGSKYITAPVPKVPRRRRRIIQRNTGTHKEDHYREDCNRPFIHAYHSCNGCKDFPIVGIRYHVVNRQDYDLCEVCHIQYCQQRRRRKVLLGQPHTSSEDNDNDEGETGQVELLEFVVQLNEDDKAEQDYWYTSFGIGDRDAIIDKVRSLEEGEEGQDYVTYSLSRLYTELVRTSRRRYDKSFMLDLCRRYGIITPYSKDKFHNEKTTLLSSTTNLGLVLEHCPKTLRSDKDVVLAACQQRGLALQHASKEFQDHKTIVMAACKESGWALQYASSRLQSDKQVVFVACQQHGLALQYASEDLRQDKDVVLTACQNHGWALEVAPEELRGDRDVVLAACTNHGESLSLASEQLRGDKEIVLAAVRNDPDALKYALNGLNQDRDCLIAAKLWDTDYQSQFDGHASQPTTIASPSSNVTSTTSAEMGKKKKKKIVLSTRFSLNEQSFSDATQFTVVLKSHPYIQEENFIVYSPNAYKNTCQKEHSYKVGTPQPESCWRYSFRYQLLEAKRTNGCMIQVVDYIDHDGDNEDDVLATEATTNGPNGSNSSKANTGRHCLGKGQEIETEMAYSVGTKIFRMYQPTYQPPPTSIPEEFTTKQGRAYSKHDMNILSNIIQNWYDNGCRDRTDCIIGMEEKNDTVLR